MTFIIPYMEASSWYSYVDFDIAWEHQLNHYQFTITIPSYRLPSGQPTFTNEGFGITHYQANPALLHRGSKVRFSDLPVGLSNIWLAGEIDGDYKPFGYPFNWRELNQPINSSGFSFGGWTDGAHFSMADASVKFISNNIDSSVLQQFATNAPLPERSLYEAPDRRFSLMT